MGRDFDITKYDAMLRELNAEADRLAALYRARHPGRPDEEFPLVFGQSGDDHVQWMRRFFGPLRGHK